MEGPLSAVSALASTGLQPREAPLQPADGEAWKATLAQAPSPAPSAGAPDMGVLARFEAVVLQNFIAAMLPDDAETVYGAGLSGDMWKSMMSEKIADQFARQGGLGIAARIAGQLGGQEAADRS